MDGFVREGQKIMNILLQIDTQGFGFRSGFDERRAENKLQMDA
jgi:hypothetical protein